MPWNPDTYNQFKKERYQPFFDLISHIEEKQGMRILDLGCGTGELTKLLAEKYEGSTVLGIDNSAEMLSNAPQHPHLRFELRTIEDQLNQNETFDLIVANASLQWVDDHSILFNKIISRLSAGGQLAIQMPSQTENILNKLLTDLVQEDLFKESLQGWVRWSPVLRLEEYAELLFRRLAKDMSIYQKVYPIIVAYHDELYDFISGSALVPYMERLDKEKQLELENKFKNKIQQSFPIMPGIYAFKRVMIYASF
jgi:trans-aconitate 2-methyltransferase